MQHRFKPSDYSTPTWTEVQPEKSACKCCGGLRELAALRSEPTPTYETREVEYWSCLACGTVEKHPKPGREELRAYYEKAWQFSEPRPPECWSSAAWWMRLRLPEVIENAIDVGAKNSLLLEAIEKTNVKVKKKHAIDAQPKNAVVERAWVGDGYHTTARYDLVVATHVLEHTVDPRDFLLDIYNMMPLGGFLYIEVPSVEMGDSDMATGDDVNPNHLFHFTLSGLMRLLSAHLFTVLRAECDVSVSGWPCNRVLAQTRLFERRPWRDLYDATEAIYRDAARRINIEWRHGDALYSASNSCWFLHEHDRHLTGNVHRLPLYDLYKSGIYRGRSIRHPRMMVPDGIKRLWLTTRFWNSEVEIRKFLAAEYPTIEVVSPYK